MFRFTVDLFEALLDENLAPLSATIFAARLLKSSSWEESDDQPSSVSATSQTTDCEGASTDSGGSTTPTWTSENSACYTEKPDFEAFLNEWTSLYESRSGERGVFSRVASQKQAARNERRDASFDFGTNPCSEIILRPYQFCNLSEVVVRPSDTLASLKRKVRVATILGTLQATLTDFRYLRSIWRANTEDEALLGVSLTGIMDHPLLSGRGDKNELKKWLRAMRQEAIKTNGEWASRLGINPSTAITVVKPSGTVSQFIDSASGIHPRYSSQYIRRVRADSRDPLCRPRGRRSPCGGRCNVTSTRVFSFPIASPEGAVTASDMGAMEQLELWRYIRMSGVSKVSMTCYYRDDEFPEVGQWLYNKFDKVSGVSFLPYSDHTYQQAPYEPVDKKVYRQLAKDFPKEISWDIEEASDMTEGSQQLACTGNNCEL